MLISIILLSISTFSQSAPCSLSYPTAPTPAPLTESSRCKVEGDTLFIDGEINADLLKILKTNSSINRIELNSAGGLVAESYSAAEIIRARGISTNVREGAICESACTLVFQSGKNRTAHASARFMFHGTRIGSGNIQFIMNNCSGGNDPKNTLRICMKEMLRQYQTTNEETDRLMNTYVKYGASSDLVARFRKQPVDKEWFDVGNFSRRQNMVLTAAELMALKLNVVQSLN